MAEGAQLECERTRLADSIPADKAAKLERTASDEVVLGIRPENLLLRPPAAPGVSRCSCAIDIVEAIGSDIYLNSATREPR